MSDLLQNPPPVREALEDVATTSRSILLKRLDLLQLEAEQLLDNAAARFYGAIAAVVLSVMALITGSVALIAYGVPEYGLAGSAGIVAAGYAISAMVAGLIARIKRKRLLGGK